MCTPKCRGISKRNLGNFWRKRRDSGWQFSTLFKL